MKINGIDFPVIGEIEIGFIGKKVPSVGIPMMTDERWSQMVAKQANKKESHRSSR